MANLTKNNEDFFSMLDDLFNRDVFDWSNNHKVGSTVPAVNIRETENGFAFDLAAPGLDKEDMKLSLERGLLTISAEKEAKEEESTTKFTRREYSYHSFKRSFRLPEKTVDSDRIEAKYENGILRVFVPKKDEVLNQGPKTIEIK